MSMSMNNNNNNERNDGYNPGRPPYYKYINDHNNDNNHNDEPTKTDETIKQNIPKNNNKKGRHLISTQNLHRGQLIFIERPLVSLQTIQNLYYNRYICYNCKAFINTPSNNLLWRCQNIIINNDNDMNDGTSNNQNTSTTNNININTDTNDSNCCISCRNECGYYYCCIKCENDSYNLHHQYLCTGSTNDINHPIVIYKQYCIETNEILLLIAEWWISQHIIYNNNNTKNNNNTTSTNTNIYTDFIMNPWWDVVTNEMIHDPTEPKAGYMNGKYISYHTQLYDICNNASILFNNIIQEYNNNTNTSNVNNIPYITAYDISCRIGAMEQNSMGIRQRNPLCNPILLMDTLLRQKYHEQYIYCLKECNLLKNKKNKKKKDDTEYTYNDIALQLSKLYINEDFSVHDMNNHNNNNDTENNDNNDDTNGMNNNKVQQQEQETQQIYNTIDGDDYEVLFPPLDGTAMYSMTCKMNHSCTPNVIVVYRSRNDYGCNYPLVAYIVALRHIEPNEELTISYINSNASYQQRQKDLLNYGFICHCTKCIIEKDQQIIQDEIEEEEDDDDNDDDDATDDDDDDNDDDTAMDTTSKEEVIDGEIKLQERLERLDSIANHSMFGRIPPYCYNPVLNYIVQTVTLLLSNHRELLLLLVNEPNETIKITTKTLKSKQLSDTVIIDLLQSCMIGVQNYDYSLCKIVGCDLETLLLGSSTESSESSDSTNKQWLTIAHREAYYCSVLVACIGYCHEYDFITAKHCIDNAIKLDLPRQCVDDFVQYIEYFANQMLSSPYSQLS